MKRTFIKSLNSIGIALGLVICLASTASAQTSEYENQLRPHGTEVRATVTIPFGTDTKSSNTKERLEFGVRTYQPERSNFDWALRSNESVISPAFRDTKVGLTLGDDPVVLLNGREWHDVNHQLGLGGDPQNNLKPGPGVVTIAAAAAAVLVLAFVLTWDGYDDEG